MLNSLLKRALGLERTVVEGVRIEGDSIIVSVRPRRAAPRCPVCGRRCAAYDRLVSVNILFTIFTNVFSPIAPTRIRRIRQRGCAAFGV